MDSGPSLPGWNAAGHFSRERLLLRGMPAGLSVPRSPSHGVHKVRCRYSNIRARTACRRLTSWEASTQMHLPALCSNPISHACARERRRKCTQHVTVTVAVR